MNDAEAAPSPSERPALVVRSGWSIWPRTRVVLNETGISWGREDRIASHAPWELIGGVRDGPTLRGPSEEILALDGSSLGGIDQMLEMGTGLSRARVSLSHVVAAYRPDLFEETGNLLHGYGCIRRTVVEAERASQRR